MLTLVLAESEIEIVPEALRSHSAVVKPAKRAEKRPSRTLLDASLHHEALKGFPEGERRGRPDIPHFAMLLALDSPANLRGALRLLVHTRNDELIRVAPETRLMRNYNRFVGLAEQLFHSRAVPKGRDLLTIEAGWSLDRVLKEEARGTKIAFDEGGAAVRPQALFRDVVPGVEATVVVGGFPKGGFRSPVRDLVDHVVSLGPVPLSAWTVVGEVLAAWEDARGLLPFPADAVPPPTPER